MIEHGTVLDEKLSYEAMADRFRFYLRELCIDEGETLHGIRAGCAISLLMSGAAKDPSAVMDHVGWFSRDSVAHYTRSNTMWDLGNTATSFARQMASTSVGSIEDDFVMYGDVTSFATAFTS